MARNTIASMNYRMYLDTKGLKKGTDEARRDFRALKNAERETATETEKLEDEFASLQRMVKDGVPGALEVMNRRLDATGKKIDKHGKIVQTYGDRLKKTGASLKAVVFNLKTLAAVVATGAIARSLSDQIDKMDQLNKTAQEAGISVEFLTEQQFAIGKLAGLSADQVSKAFIKMSRRIAEAAAGTGEAKTVLEEFGLSAEELNRMGPEKAFYIVAEAISNLTSDTDKLRTATKLFDDEQARMFIALTNGTQAIDEQREIARQLGVTVSQIQVDRMSALADKFADIGASWDRFTRTFTDKFGGVIIRLLDNMSEVMEQFNLGSPDQIVAPVVNNRFGVGDVVGGFPQLFNARAYQNPGGPFGYAYSRRLEAERKEFEDWRMQRDATAEAQRNEMIRLQQLQVEQNQYGNLN